jgi:hypothetical protein
MKPWENGNPNVNYESLCNKEFLFTDLGSIRGNILLTVRSIYSAVAAPKIICVIYFIIYDVIGAIGSNRRFESSTCFLPQRHTLLSQQSVSRLLRTRILALGPISVAFSCLQRIHLTKGACAAFRTSATNFSFATGASNYLLPDTILSINTAAPSDDILVFRHLRCVLELCFYACYRFCGFRDSPKSESMLDSSPMSAVCGGRGF